MTLRLSHCVCESHRSEEQSALSSAPPPPGRWREVGWEWEAGVPPPHRMLKGSPRQSGGERKWPGSSGVPTEPAQGRVRRAAGLGPGPALRGLSGSRPWSCPLAAHGSGISPDFVAGEQHLWDTFCSFRCRDTFCLRGGGSLPLPPSIPLPPWTHTCCSPAFPPNSCPGPLPPWQPRTRLTEPLTCPASLPDLPCFPP